MVAYLRWRWEEILGTNPALRHLHPLHLSLHLLHLQSEKTIFQYWVILLSPLSSHHQSAVNIESHEDVQYKKKNAWVWSCWGCYCGDDTERLTLQIQDNTTWYTDNIPSACYTRHLQQPQTVFFPPKYQNFPCSHTRLSIFYIWYLQVNSNWTLL